MHDTGKRAHGAEPHTSTCLTFCDVSSTSVRKLEKLREREPPATRRPPSARNQGPDGPWREGWGDAGSALDPGHPWVRPQQAGAEADGPRHG